MKLEDLSSDLIAELDVMLTLKMKDFRESHFKTLTKEDLLKYLFQIKWKRKEAIFTYDIVNDIFDLSASSIFEFLQSEGIKSASKQTIDDFQDLLI